MPPAPDLDQLDSLSRDELIARARELGAQRPEVMTRVELRDEIVRLSEPDLLAQKKQRGWLGVARDLVASVVESGLNMRDAAAKIRGERGDDVVGPPPVATVTLAEIYIAQGHPERALAVIEEVLEGEPDHGAALALREKLRERGTTAERRRARVVEAVPDTNPPPAEPVETEAEAEAEDALPTLQPQPASKREPEPEPACLLVREGAGWLAHYKGVPSGGLVLRVVAFVPGKPTPRQITRDMPLFDTEGSAALLDLPGTAVVRGALGRLENDVFKPVVVAAVHAEAPGHLKTHYRPPGQTPSSLERDANS
jgi:hypothetical protein